MLQRLKNYFNSRYIKFSFVGKFGLDIKTNLKDEELQEFLYMIYSQSLINDIINNLKVFKEDQYIRIIKIIEEAASKVEEIQKEQEESQNNSPIIGVFSENNNMGRS